MNEAQAENIIREFLNDEMETIIFGGFERNRLLWQIKFVLSEKLNFDIGESLSNYGLVSEYRRREYRTPELKFILDSIKIRLLNEEEIIIPASILVYLIIYYPIDTTNIENYINLLRNTARKITEAYTIFSCDTLTVSQELNSIIDEFRAVLVG